MLVPFKLFKRVPFDLGAKVQINGQIGHVSRTGRCIQGDSHFAPATIWRDLGSCPRGRSEDMDCFFVSVASRDAAGSSAKLAVLLLSHAKLHGVNARIFGSASVVQAAIHSGKSSYAVGGRETVPPEILEYIGNGRF